MRWQQILIQMRFVQTDENFAINGVAGQAEVQQVNILDQDEADRFYEKNNGKRYDVVVANILADVIIPLSGIVTPLLKEDGIFITSGIINTRRSCKGSMACKLILSS